MAWIESKQLELSFAEKLTVAKARFGSLCIGLDPSRTQLSQWGLEDSVEGLRRFSELCIAQMSNRVGIAKPQVACFERFGSSGFAILTDLVAQLRAAGMVVIADAKRGDIGNTMMSYMDAWLGQEGVSADALTVHSFMGMDVLENSLESLATAKTRGLFALCATSNSEGFLIQTAKTNQGETVAKHVMRRAELASKQRGLSVGVVVGATLRLEDYGLGEYLDRTSEVPILAPGFGEQGAQLEDIRLIFGESARQVIPNLSRSILGEDSKTFGDRILTAQEKIS